MHAVVCPVDQSFHHILTSHNICLLNHLSTQVSLNLSILMHSSSLFDEGEGNWSSEIGF